MLYLDARIHLDEVDLAVFIHEEFDRAGIPVADLPQRPLDDATQPRARLRGYLQRRSLFDQLLVAALNGAFALAQAHHVAVFIGQHLELDVTRPLDEFLHVQVAVAEGVQCLGRRLVVQDRAVRPPCGRCACRVRRRLQLPSE